MVSLPFADHCEPLVDAGENLTALLHALQSARESKYVELRPLSRHIVDGTEFHDTEAFRFHVVDLRPALSEIFERFHASTIRRKIRRAERDGVTCEQGRSEALVRDFYRLMILTRRRHGLAPQPIDWFRNVLACFGERATIRVARAQGVAIAALLTLRHRETLVYKYGCSDARAHPMGAMPLLFWSTIQDAKHAGVYQLDLGRSDSTNSGLIAFKERLGGIPSTITYARFAHASLGPAMGRRTFTIPRVLVERLPDRVLAVAGGLLYRHMG